MQIVIQAAQSTNPEALCINLQKPVPIGTSHLCDKDKVHTQTRVTQGWWEGEKYEIEEEESEKGTFMQGVERIYIFFLFKDFFFQVNNLHWPWHGKGIQP